MPYRYPTLRVGQFTETTRTFALYDDDPSGYDERTLNLMDAVSVTITLEHANYGWAPVNGAGCTITDAAAGEVEYTFAPLETVVPGRYYVQFVVEWSNGETELVPPAHEEWTLDIGRRLPHGLRPLSVGTFDADEARISTLQSDNITATALDAARLENGLLGSADSLTRLDGSNLEIVDGELGWVDPSTGGFTDGADHDHSATGAGGDTLRPAVVGTPTTPAGSGQFESLNNVTIARPGDDLQAKINEAGVDGTLYIAPGTHTRSTELYVRDGQEIFGHPQRTTIDGSLLADADDLFNIDAVAPDTISGVRIHDLHLIGNAAYTAKASHLIDIHQGSSDIRVWNIEGEQTGRDVVSVGYCSDVTIWNIVGRHFGDDVVDVTQADNVNVYNVEGYDSEVVSGSSGSVVEFDDGSENGQASDIYGERVHVVFEVHTSQGDPVPSSIQANNIRASNCKQAAFRVSDQFDVAVDSSARNIQVSGIQVEGTPYAALVQIGRDIDNSLLKNIQISNVQGHTLSNYPVRINVGDTGTINQCTVDNVQVSDGTARAVFIDVDPAGTLTGFSGSSYNVADISSEVLAVTNTTGGVYSNISAENMGAGITFANATDHYVKNVKLENTTDRLVETDPNCHNIHIDGLTVINTPSGNPSRLSSPVTFRDLTLKTVAEWRLGAPESEIVSAQVSGADPNGAYNQFSVEANDCLLKDIRATQIRNWLIAVRPGVSGTVIRNIKTDGTETAIIGVEAGVDNPATDTRIYGSEISWANVDDGGVRTTVNDLGFNAGNPSSTGEWFGHGYDGLVVFDTSLNDGTTYRYVNGTWY